MSHNLSEERERELTEKITLWIGGKRNKPFQDRWKPLSSRDKWAIVEEEIERRGAVEEYINALEHQLGIYAVLPDDGHAPHDLMKFRLANPTICALALEQIIDKELT